MEKKWICIEIFCGMDVLDDLAAELVEAFGVSVELIEKGVRFYLAGEDFQKASEEKLRSLLKIVKESHSLPMLPTYRTSLLLDDDWADRWKEHFKPLRVGKHFLICPTWEQPHATAGDRVILIDPGRAFGTGHHETTRLCLEWLEESVHEFKNMERKSLLDVGTGSGILAMASALLGFEPVLGIDNDPEAIEVAAENLELNHLSHKIQLEVTTVADVKERYSVVISNIQSIPLIEMASAMVRRVEPSGRLVLSGILVEQKADVQAAYEQAGMKLTRSRTDGEWCLLAFE